MNDKIFKFNDVCFMEGWFYFSAIEFNGLFRWKEGQPKAEFVSSFDGEQTLQENLHSHVVLYERKMYFIPFNGSGVSIYDVDSGKMDFVSITGDIGTKAKIATAFIMECKLYLIPTNNVNDFRILDLQKGEMGNWEELTARLKELRVDYYCDVYGAVLKNNEIYITIFGTGIIVKFNLLNNCFKKMFYENHKMGNISLIGEDCYITTCDGRIYKLNEQDDMILELDLETKTRYFFKVCENKESLFAIPCFGDSLFMKKKKSNNWICMKDLLPKEFKRQNQGEPLVWGHQNVAGKLFLFPKASNRILAIEEDCVIFYNLEMVSSMNGIKKSLVRRNIYTKEGETSVMYESGFMDIKDLISVIME